MGRKSSRQERVAFIVASLLVDVRSIAIDDPVWSHFWALVCELRNDKLDELVACALEVLYRGSDPLRVSQLYIRYLSLVGAYECAK